MSNIIQFERGRMPQDTDEAYAIKRKLQCYQYSEVLALQKYVDAEVMAMDGEDVLVKWQNRQSGGWYRVRIHPNGSRSTET